MTESTTPAVLVIYFLDKQTVRDDFHWIFNYLLVWVMVMVLVMVWVRASMVLESA